MNMTRENEREGRQKADRTELKEDYGKLKQRDKNYFLNRLSVKEYCIYRG